MADTEVTVPADQTDVQMPSGVVLTGMGGDSDALAETFEHRHEQRTGETVEAVIETNGEAQKEPRGRKRFSQLTGERDAALARAEEAERKAKEIEAQLRARADQSEAAVRPKAAEEVTPKGETFTRPKPSDAEIGTKYSSLSDYFEDLADWKAEQRETKLRTDFDARLKESIEADRASRTRQSVVNEAFTRGRTQYTDFDAVLKSADAILIPPSHQDAIQMLPNFEHILYALGKDHAKLKEVIGITNPVQLGVALAQLIPRPEAVALPASTPVAVRQSNAPAPPQPGGSGSRTAQRSLTDIANSGDYESYKARRNADRGVK